MPNSIPFLSLKEIDSPVRGQLLESLERVIDSGIYINGPETKAFSKELADLLGLSAVVPVSNGLDAIRLIIRGYMERGLLREGDEVMVPANTYIASVLPVSEFNLMPRLIEPDLTTYGIDWRKAVEALNSKTKALITVHLYGTPSWDFEAAEYLKKQNVLIIEDNAQAIGASIINPATGTTCFTGSLGDAAAFSFYPTKNIGALGDAGAVATRDQQLAETIRALANYGSRERYHNKFIGYNCRMDELQAACLRVKLSRLNEISQQRQERAALYDRLINNPQITKPKILKDMVQVWHQYVVRTSRRRELRELLAQNGISTDIHYPLSLFEQECYCQGTRKLMGTAWAKETARKLAQEVMSLPIASIDNNQIEEITNLINRFS